MYKQYEVQVTTELNKKENGKIIVPPILLTIEFRHSKATRQHLLTDEPYETENLLVQYNNASLNVIFIAPGGRKV